MVTTYKGIEIPENDAERVEAVKSYRILETPPEQEFDDITELAAQICGCPVAYISIFDDARSWLKSSYGLPTNRPPRPRELSMCAPTICQSELLIVPDMSQNSRYSQLPAVANPPHARAYCAMPLINSDGYALGTLCVWSPEAVEFDEVRQTAMRRLARLVLKNLEQRRALANAQAELSESQERLERGRAALQRAESVSYRMLPSAMAARVLAGAEVPARAHEVVSLVYVDFEDFPEDFGPGGSDVLVADLQAYYALFDALFERHGMTRARISGTAYLASAGLPRFVEEHAEMACAAARDLCDEVAVYNRNREIGGEAHWSIRVGIHSGPIVGGVIDGKRLTYGVWGEAVYVAQRMQQEANLNEVKISEATAGLIALHRR